MILPTKIFSQGEKEKLESLGIGVDKLSSVFNTLSDLDDAYRKLIEMSGFLRNINSDTVTGFISPIDATVYVYLDSLIRDISGYHIMWKKNSQSIAASDYHILVDIYIKRATARCIISAIVHILYTVKCSEVWTLIQGSINHGVLSKVERTICTDEYESIKKFAPKEVRELVNIANSSGTFILNRVEHKGGR